MVLPCTVHPVDIFGEEQFKPEFLKLNPNAKYLHYSRPLTTPLMRLSPYSEPRSIAG
jgi:hypothetical protein